MLLGSSAGGQIAAAVGTYGKGTGLVRGVVALSPVARPTAPTRTAEATGASAAERKLRDNSTLLAGCHPQHGRRHLLEPLDRRRRQKPRLSGGTPMYLLHSKGDFVPSTHSADLCAALKAKKVGCTLQVVAGRRTRGSHPQDRGIHSKILTWLQAHDR